jgi:hypothetical protein
MWTSLQELDSSKQQQLLMKAAMQSPLLLETLQLLLLLMAASGPAKRLAVLTVLPTVSVTALPRQPRPMATQ